MRRVLSHISRVIFGAVLFCVFFLEISLVPLIFGAISGLIFSLLSYRIERDHSGFWGFWSLKYYLSLFANMISSTISLAISVFKKNPPTVLIKTEDAKCSEPGQVLVSNSITLTPGTLTLDKRDDVYTILTIKNDKNDSAVAEQFEKNLK